MCFERQGCSATSQPLLGKAKGMWRLAVHSAMLQRTSTNDTTLMWQLTTAGEPAALSFLWAHNTEKMIWKSMASTLHVLVLI